MPDRKYIFVGGAPRSGTTLVQNILDSHPSICGLPEFKNLPHIIGLMNRMIEESRIGYIDDICKVDEIKQNFKDFIHHFLQPQLNKYDCKVISEKTPQNILVFDELIELFPRSKFIFVVRDPRDIISSYVKVRKKARKIGISSPVGNIKEAIDRTKEHLSKGLKTYDLYTEKILIIKYEEVVEQTENETKKICDFLKIEWDHAMTRPGEKKHPGEKGMTTGYNQAYYDKKMFNRNVSRKSLKSWQKHLTKTELIQIEKAFAPLDLESKFGYNLRVGNISMVDRLKSKLIVSKNKVERIYFTLSSLIRKLSRI